MHKRTAHRWRLLIIMMSGTFLALGSFWLAQMMDEQGAALGSDAFRDEPDYIVEKFSFVRMSPDGEPRYLISGAKLTHRPLDDSADIEQPQVRTVGAGHPPMTIVARNARVDHGNTQVHLSGDVNIERKAAATTRPMRLRTEALTIFPDDDQLKSDQPVSIESNGSRITGTGLFIDNAKRQMSIDSKVHIVLPPATGR
jgi:lipopolysaccharide export system protein LptC